jgi:hypothetical protein
MYGSWLHFDEILIQKELMDVGIYDCFAHYPLLIDAVRLVNFLDTCPFSSVVVIGSLKKV